MYIYYIYEYFFGSKNVKARNFGEFENQTAFQDFFFLILNIFRTKEKLSLLSEKEGGGEGGCVFLVRRIPRKLKHFARVCDDKETSYHFFFFRF